jgi:hypothetical protein
VPTIVSIRTEDSRATELPPWVDAIDPARLRISRSGDLSRDLLVFFSVGGSATSEHDYQGLIFPVRIPAGADSVGIDIWAIWDELKEDMEIVLVKLEPSPLMGPQLTYEIDPQNSFSVAGIFDGVSELEPVVVRIETVSRIAEESSYPFRRLPFVGELRISRTGPTTNSLPVFVTYSGIAAEGKDYQALPFVVTIPEAADSTVLRVPAVPDQLAEGIETLVATISNCPPPPMMPPCLEFFATMGSRRRAL